MKMGEVWWSLPEFIYLDLHFLFLCLLNFFYLSLPIKSISQQLLCHFFPVRFLWRGLPSFIFYFTFLFFFLCFLWILWIKNGWSIPSFSLKEWFLQLGLCSHIGLGYDWNFLFMNLEYSTKADITNSIISWIIRIFIMQTDT